MYNNMKMIIMMWKCNHHNYIQLYIIFADFSGAETNVVQKM